MSLPKSINNLSDSLSALPGIGPKASKRLALYLSLINKKSARRLEESLSECEEKIQYCTRCFNVSESELCEICSDATRDNSIILIVETPLDLYSIEETGRFKGLYHVLTGVISPVNGVGPEDIKIKDLIERLKNEKFEEMIFGLNPNVEGDSTSLFIKSEIENSNLEIKISKLAKGIPVGSNIEFMSSQTISDAFSSRTSF